jgi:hypothetical protein
MISGSGAVLMSPSPILPATPAAIGPEAATMMGGG